MITFNQIFNILGPIQNAHGHGDLTPCPRCGGKLAEPISANPTSKHVLIKICSTCSAIEATDPRPLTIEHWHCFKNVKETSRNDFQPSECEKGGCHS